MPESNRSLEGVRIVHAATSANMLTAFGRVMASRLVEEGAELYFLASSKPIYGRQADQRELRAMGGEPLTIPLENNLRPINLLGNTFKLWRLFRRVRPEIVHTRASVMGIVGRTAAWLARVPCVVHHQDDLHAREANLSPVKRWLSGRLEAWLANRSDHTFVVSEAVFAAAERNGFNMARVTNVGHDLSASIRAGAQSPPDPATVEQMLSALGVGAEHFVVGAITRLERHKGVDTLIQAAAILVSNHPTIRFVIRGRGPEHERLEALISSLGLKSYVMMLDAWLNDEDLVALYQRFDLFVLPTRREGFGMAFAEAMLLGTVPVAPDIKPVNEVVTAHTGLLAEPTAQSFAKAIDWAIANPEKLAAIRTAGQTEALRRWGSTATADRVIATYDNLRSASQCV